MPHTLLLADDSLTIQRVIELTFADEDVQVVAVSDGDQAIARLDSAPPDIVLADIGMPGRNGYEVARYVKQSPRLSHIPVVLLTGAFEPVDQARAIEVGCDGVLAKPFEPQLVIGRVKELLASEPKRAHAASTAGAPAAAGSDAGDLDDYFDRLDVAFSRLATQPIGKGSDEPEIEAEPRAVMRSDEEPSEEPRSLADQIDWYAQHGTETPSSAVETPSPTAPEPASVAPAPATYAGPMPVPVPPSRPAEVSGVPSIAEAFAAILAAEQHEPVPDGAPEWPRSFAPPPPPEITAEVVDAVTRRVLDQMSDRVVRQTVSTIVADIAERLVREEIAKIKSALR